ncbi:helix-turn-helix domain-containing protein [Lichenibacterium minor]|nr:XRE family transcriptional regulator [Lichenibacterium minor]
MLDATQPVPPGSPDAGSVDVGARLKRFRTERKLTITQLADRSGVSSGMISQIERGTTNPSIKILQRLRSALGVNLWDVLDENASAEPRPSPSSAHVLRRANRPRIVVGESRLVKELLSPRKDRNLRFMIITLPAGGVSEDVIVGEGEKGGLVTDGRVRLTVGQEVSDLDEGDSFQFPSSLPHALSNPHAEPAKVVWIMSVLDSHI